MRSNVRSLVALALAVAVLAYPTTVFATEEGTAAEGAAAGQMDGRANTSGPLWLGAGCLFGIFAVGAAYLITPNPPATRLLGQSSEYVAAYTDAYERAGKNEQTNNALIGCLAGYAVTGVIYLLAAAAAASTY